MANKYYCRCIACLEKNAGKPKLVSTQTLRNHRLKEFRSRASHNRTAEIVNSQTTTECKSKLYIT